MTIKIVDPVTRCVVPRGTSGEICVKGAHPHAWLHRHTAGRNARRGRVFPTGDDGYLDELGRLFWNGRLTDIIKTGGANVSPLEVDEALTAHQNVKVAKTIGLPMRRWVRLWSPALSPRWRSRSSRRDPGIPAATLGEL